MPSTSAWPHIDRGVGVGVVVIGHSQLCFQEVPQRHQAITQLLCACSHAQSEDNFHLNSNRSLEAVSPGRAKVAVLVAPCFSVRGTKTGTFSR